MILKLLFLALNANKQEVFLFLLSIIYFMPSISSFDCQYFKNLFLIYFLIFLSVIWQNIICGIAPPTLFYICNLLSFFCNFRSRRMFSLQSIGTKYHRQFPSSFLTNSASQPLYPPAIIFLSLGNRSTRFAKDRIPWEAFATEAAGLCNVQHGVYHFPQRMFSLSLVSTIFFITCHCLSVRLVG